MSTSYANVEASVNVDAVIPPTSWTAQAVEVWLLDQISDIRPGSTLTIDDDLFEQGMDSLSTTILRRRIVGAMQLPELQKAAQLVTQTTIYNNPRVTLLARFLVGIVADPDDFVAATSKAEAIELTISKYARGLSDLPSIPTEKKGISGLDDTVVLITGTTGNLGSQLLEALLRDRRVKTVYALNRRGQKSMLERHMARFVDKGLGFGLLSSDRVIFLEGESSQRNLGLDDKIYDEVRGLCRLLTSSD